MLVDADLLAPLQTIMLQDSLAAGGDRHVEQVEIIFADDVEEKQVASAWRAMVTRTAVLQMAFVIDCGEPLGWAKTQAKAGLTRHAPTSAGPGEWLAADRVQPLLVPGNVPWRVAYWPHDRRWVWTFHHALLDGRSISRILHGFFRTLNDGAPPGQLG